MMLMIDDNGQSHSSYLAGNSSYGPSNINDLVGGSCDSSTVCKSDLLDTVSEELS